MSKKIILNSMPPVNHMYPFLAPSLLKSYMKSHDYEVEVVYWNLILYDVQNEFLWNDRKNINDQNIMLLYLNYIAIYKNDLHIYEYVKIMLKTLNNYHANESEYYDNHMRCFAEKTNTIIDNYLLKYDFSNILYFGYTLKLDQWFVASIISEKVKNIAPDIFNVVGGISSKESAREYLLNIKQFDFAIWGEGEVPMLLLTQEIEKKSKDYDTVNNLVYNENGNIKYSANNKIEYVDLSNKNIFPDYSDYFRIKKELNIRLNNNILISIEGSRGCHWCKCKFCYLNHGYKYRLKSIEVLSEEIDYMIKTYGSYLFQFLDTDLVGKDTTRFNKLLNKLIKIREKYPEFRVVMAEIITKDLDKRTIQNMALAGITHVQIGYENTSNNILKNINKKNTFASNLNFIKHAQKNDINTLGLNLIVNLPEEKNEYIIEAIDNLFYLRFYIAKGLIHHSITYLQVNKNSKYYGKIDISDWDVQTTLAHFYQHKISESGKLFFFDYVRKSHNFLWGLFQSNERYYHQNPYKYRLVKENNKVIYSEYRLNEKISQYEMEDTSLELKILYNTNDKAISISSLCTKLNNNKTNYNEIEIKNSIDALFKRGLVYHSDNFDEILSVIDIEDIK